MLSKQTCHSTYHSVFVKVQTLAIAHSSEIDGVNPIASLGTDLPSLAKSECAI